MSGYVFAIIPVGIVCMGLISYFDKLRELDFGNELLALFADNFILKMLFEHQWLVALLRSSVAKILLIMGIILFFVISVIKLFFTQNYDYHIDMETEKVYLRNGTWKLRKEVILDFNEIKSIVLVHYIHHEMTEDNNRVATDAYKIELYDNAENAYAVYDNPDYDDAKKIALEIGEIINREVIDSVNEEKDIKDIREIIV
jgi:hypothetical protein